MKKTVIIYILGLLTVLNVQAQNSFFYQATLKDTEGKPVIKDIDVRFTILADDALIYAETHQTKTDDNGHYVLYIGEGNPETGNFAETDWSKGSFQIKTEVDKGEGYTLVGTQSLTSVPYAMQAEMAGGIQQKSLDGTTWNVVVDNEGNLSTEKVVDEIIPIPAGYSRLVFHDEFNGEGLVDSDKWNYEEGWVRNGEEQYYTVAREENCYQKDGLLHMVCEYKDVFIPNAKLNRMWEEWETRRGDTTVKITSPSITTENIQSWKYCRVDMRAKLPMCKGTWPAIWMMPQHSVYGMWPKSGEIDIMEHVGYDPDNVHFTLHCFDHNSSQWPNLYNKSVTCSTSYTEFHIYTLEWTEDRIAWYLDGRLRYFVDRPANHTWKNWPFDQEFYLILNHAFGGGWGGQQGVDYTGLPQDYQIDYIRVYQ